MGNVEKKSKKKADKYQPSFSLFKIAYPTFSGALSSILENSKCPSTP